MNLQLTQLNRLFRLHELIKSECTGSPAELALKMHVSIRTITFYVEELRDMGALVSFSRSRLTYFYENDFEIIFHFEIKVSDKVIFTENE